MCSTSDFFYKLFHFCQVYIIPKKWNIAIEPKFSSNFIGTSGMRLNLYKYETKFNQYMPLFDKKESEKCTIGQCEIYIFF